MRLNNYQWAAVAAALITPTLYFLVRTKMQRLPGSVQLKNLKAFLLMIQYSEGTIGTNAYRTLYGGGLFSDFSRHPNIAITKWGITSTAAGAYQILFRTWADLQGSLNLPDFSPVSQNKAAIELIRKKGALQDVLAGRFSQGVYKCRKVWASLPGAGYGQGEQSLASISKIYQAAGGKILVA